MRLDIHNPDPVNDYTCDICNGTGYSDVGQCGMCEGDGEVCWRPIDSQWVAVPIKYKNTPAAELEKLCDELIQKL
jgi:DnaJ-class molecular chaperone